MRLKLILGMLLGIWTAGGFVAYADDTPPVLVAGSSGTMNPCNNKTFYDENPALCHPAVDPEPTVEELLKDGEKVVSDWRSLGAVAGLIAAINFLMNLTKMGTVGAYIKQKKLKWIRPLLSAALGGFVGAATAMATDMPVVTVALHGILAGVGSVGFHELVEALKSEPEKG